MTAKTLAASVIAVLAITACGTTTRQSGSVGSSPTVAWANCMRSRGVTGFPDPIAGHTDQFPDSAGTILATHSPAVLAAEQACQSLNPVTRVAVGSQAASQRAGFLEFATCMRAHGVPSYPDPTYDKGGRPNAPDLSSLGIDTQSPAFIAAGQACNGHGTPIG
jgi:hypothetical protein